MAKNLLKLVNRATLLVNNALALHLINAKNVNLIFILLSNSLSVQARVLKDL